MAEWVMWLGIPCSTDQCEPSARQVPITEANMITRSSLTLGLALALVLSFDARADKFPAEPPQPKLFSSVYGYYALKILPDLSSVGTQAGQVIGKSQGVFFTLDEHAK